MSGIITAIHGFEVGDILQVSTLRRLSWRRRLLSWPWRPWRVWGDETSVCRVTCISPTTLTVRPLP